MATVTTAPSSGGGSTGIRSRSNLCSFVDSDPIASIDALGEKTFKEECRCGMEIGEKLKGALNQLTTEMRADRKLHRGPF